MPHEAQIYICTRMLRVFKIDHIYQFLFDGLYLRDEHTIAWVRHIVFCKTNQF